MFCGVSFAMFAYHGEVPTLWHIPPSFNLHGTSNFPVDDYHQLSNVLAFLNALGLPVSN
jgi:cytochrome c oxidase assembly factor CtaG